MVALPRGDSAMASGMVRLDRLPGLCQTSQARVPRDRSDVFPHKVAGNSRRASPRSDSGAVQEASGLSLSHVLPVDVDF